MKTVYINLVVVCCSMILFSCNNISQDEKVDSRKDSLSVNLGTDTLKLANSKCFSCHSPNMEIDNRLAPPMFKVKEHYISDSINKTEFVNSVWKFVQNPSEDVSIMPGAVRNFGLMPKQDFKEEEVKAIASYIYDNDVSADSWYMKWEAINKKQ
jgi:hypothetical protein